MQETDMLSLMRKPKNPAKKQSPTLYILAGPNGAGKTSLAKDLLPQFLDCYEFVNADFLALGLSPLSPERAAILAGRLMIQRVSELTKGRKTFALETTLSGRTYVKLIKKLKLMGYKVDITFMWLPNVSIALERVQQRVKKGGHNIPDEVIRRRFKSGIINLFSHYIELSDSWRIWDASLVPPEEIVKTKNGNISVLNSSKFDKIREEL